MEKIPTVAVGLSGGVDSSLAAALLVDSGYKVIGLTMKIWRGAYKIQEGLKHACYGPGEEEDIEACQKLADSLGIGYQVIDLSEEYEKRVIEYFKAEYLAGRTPNPCIVCNRELKFGFLADKAKALGIEFDFFATGHYARKERVNGVTFLKKAADESKDQSYFLYGLDSDRLETILFPLGEMTKSQVRALARQHSLEVAEKPESQDFIAGGDYAPLFEGKEPEPGEMVDTKGKILGKHRGLPYYTVGQRRGLGISVGPEPLYVISLDASKNRVVLGPNTGLFAEGLISRNFRFQDPLMAREKMDILSGYTAKIRQNHKPVPISLFWNEGAEIYFETPQRAIAPGQSVVIYSPEGRVVGGGIIDKAIETLDD
jgi:tRNA-specific 2-thiouridylase